MYNFFKWLTITSVFTVLYGLFEYKYQFFTNMAETDPFYICYSLWGMGLLVVLEGLHATTAQRNRLSLLSYASTLLGILGTFLGISGALGCLSPESFDPTNLELVKNTMGELSQNFYTALSTSICGILVSLPALSYMFFLEGETVEKQS